jgi:hypothetical protein
MTRHLGVYSSICYDLFRRISECPDPQLRKPPPNDVVLKHAPTYTYRDTNGAMVKTSAPSTTCSADDIDGVTAQKVGSVCLSSCVHYPHAG